LQKAIVHFEKAIEKEPNYAPAYAGISVCLGFAWYFGFLPPNEIVSNWKAITDAALEINNQSTEAHLSLAHFYFLYEWNWTEAEKEYKRAVELMPSNGEAHCFYSTFLAARERFDEAIIEARRAVELDPLSLVTNLYVGFTYLFADRFEEAAEQAKWMSEIEPNFFGTHWLMGGVHQKKAEKDAAVEAFKKAFALSGNIKIQSYLGYAYGVSGDREAALDILNVLLELRTKQYVAEINIARVYGGLGDKDKAFEWLEKAVEERNGELVFLGIDAKASEKETWGKSLLHDARFQDLMKRVGLSS
jgi:Tfp pilus assembly protein PilF